MSQSSHFVVSNKVNITSVIKLDFNRNKNFNNKKLLLLGMCCLVSCLG